MGVDLHWCEEHRVSFDSRRELQEHLLTVHEGRPQTDREYHLPEPGPLVSGPPDTLQSTFPAHPDPVPMPKEEPMPTTKCPTVGCTRERGHRGVHNGPNSQMVARARRGSLAAAVANVGAGDRPAAAALPEPAIQTPARSVGSEAVPDTSSSAPPAAQPGSPITLDLAIRLPLEAAVELGLEKFAELLGDVDALADAAGKRYEVVIREIPA